MKDFNRFLFCGLAVLLMTASSFSLTDQQEDPLEQSIDNGKNLYASFCLQCHQSDGEGIPSVYPPLTINNRLTDKEMVIKTITEGKPGGSTIDGVTYAAPMPPVQLKNEQIADVLNYIRNSWGNKSEYLSPSDVQSVRNNKE